MANRYLKIEPEESKKIQENLDYSKSSLNNILMILRNYKLSRKKEIILKNKLKVNISALRVKLNDTELTFPEEERKEALDKIYKEQQKNQKSRFESKKRPEIQEPEYGENEDYQEEYSDESEELADIRNQLSKIGS